MMNINLTTFAKNVQMFSRTQNATIDIDRNATINLMIHLETKNNTYTHGNKKYFIHTY